MKTSSAQSVAETVALRVAVGLELVIGLTALVGGLLLIAAPSGSALGMSPGMLAGSPFDDYTIPGIVLAFLFGIGYIAVAVMTWERFDHLPQITISAALALLVWLGVQAAMIGFAWQQLAVALVALALAVVSGWLPERRRIRGRTAT